jgi:competence protein ComEC
MNKIKSKKFTFYLLGTLVVAAVLVWLAVFQKTESKNNLKIVFCDVGQGDAIFIQKSVDEDFLIDGGPNNSVLNCLGKNMPYYDRKIKSVILTHPHADHISGLIEVLERYQVEEIWITGVEYNSSEYLEFKKEIQEKNIKVNIAYTAEMIANNPDLTLKILYPLTNIQGKTFDNLNNSSIVIKMTYSHFTALFAGDLEKTAQPDLLKNPDLKSKILKVPHHGSLNGLSNEFLNQIKPEVAVISVGENNSYGHPAAETLKKLNDILGLKILRTDKNGEIKIFSDGSKYWIRTEQ